MLYKISCQVHIQTHTCRNWEIFTNHIPDKVLVPRLYKEFSKLNIKIASNQMERMGNGFYQTFHQKRYTFDTQAPARMFNIIHYKENTNLNHKEISLLFGRLKLKTDHTEY